MGDCDRFNQKCFLSFPALSPTVWRSRSLFSSSVYSFFCLANLKDTIITQGVQSTDVKVIFSFCIPLETVNPRNPLLQICFWIQLKDCTLKFLRDGPAVYHASCRERTKKKGGRGGRGGVASFFFLLVAAGSEDRLYSLVTAPTVKALM